jgi:CDP-diglyceride synthetase
MFTYFRHLATNPMQSNESSIEIGLRLSKWGSYLLSLLLLFVAFAEGRQAIPENREFFHWFKILYCLVFSAWIQLPYQKLNAKLWNLCFAALCFLAVGFVFLMVVVVMFAYIESAERGERLGVPGFQGTLIFLALMQIPSILFRKNPDLLD